MTLKQIDARELAAGMLLMRGSPSNQCILREVRRVRETVMTVPCVGEMRVTEVMHGRPGLDGDLATINYPHGCRVGVMLLNPQV